MVKKFDNVKLKNRCDSGYLLIGDTGQAMSDELEDGFVAVAFDEEFHDASDCDGMVSSGNGWFVKATDLEVIENVAKINDEEFAQSVLETAPFEFLIGVIGMEQSDIENNEKELYDLIIDKSKSLSEEQKQHFSKWHLYNKERKK